MLDMTVHVTKTKEHRHNLSSSDDITTELIPKYIDLLQDRFYLRDRLIDERR